MKLSDCLIDLAEGKPVLFKFVSDSGSSIFLKNFINSSCLSEFYNLFGSCIVVSFFAFDDYFKIVLKFDVSNISEIFNKLFIFSCLEVVYA